MQTCKYLLSKYQKYLKKLKKYHLKIEKFDPKKLNVMNHYTKLTSLM